MPSQVVQPAASSASSTLAARDTNCTPMDVYNIRPYNSRVARLVSKLKCARKAATKIIRKTAKKVTDSRSKSSKGAARSKNTKSRLIFPANHFSKKGSSMTSSPRQSEATANPVANFDDLSLDPVGPSNDEEYEENGPAYGPRLLTYGPLPAHDPGYCASPHAHTTTSMEVCEWANSCGIAVNDLWVREHATQPGVSPGMPLRASCLNRAERHLYDVPARLAVGFPPHATGMKGFCFLGGGHDRYPRGAMGLKKPNDDDFPSWHRRVDGSMVPTQRLPRGIFLPERSHLSEMQTIDYAPYSTPQPVPEPVNKGMKEDPPTPLGAFVAGRSLRRKRAMVVRHLGQSPEAAIYQPSVARFKCCAEEERYEDILLSTAGASGKMLAGLRIGEDSLSRIVDSSDSAAGHAGDSALAENEREQTAALYGDKSISPLVESGEDGLVTHGSSDVQIDDEVTLDSISAIGLSPAVSARLNTPFSIVKLNSGPLNPIAEALEESAEEMADETGGGCETESEREPTGPTGEAKELQLTKEKDLTGWTSSATFMGTSSGSAAEETLASHKISGKISRGCNHLNLEDFETAPPDSFSDVDVGPSGPRAFAPVPGHKAAPQRKNMSFSSIFDGANNPFPGPPAAHWWQQPNPKPTEPPTNSTPEPIRSDDVPLLPGQVFPWQKPYEKIVFNPRPTPPQPLNKASEEESEDKAILAGQVADTPKHSGSAFLRRLATAGAGSTEHWVAAICSTPCQCFNISGMSAENILIGECHRDDRSECDPDGISTESIQQGGLEAADSFAGSSAERSSAAHYQSRVGLCSSFDATPLQLQSRSAAQLADLQASIEDYCGHQTQSAPFRVSVRPELPSGVAFAEEPVESKIAKDGKRLRMPLLVVPAEGSTISQYQEPTRGPDPSFAGSWDEGTVLVEGCDGEADRDSEEESCQAKLGEKRASIDIGGIFYFRGGL